LLFVPKIIKTVIKGEVFNLDALGLFVAFCFVNGRVASFVAYLQGSHMPLNCIVLRGVQSSTVYCTALTTVLLLVYRCRTFKNSLGVLWFALNLLFADDLVERELFFDSQSRDL